jgi:hypothetical protein
VNLARHLQCREFGGDWLSPGGAAEANINERKQLFCKGLPASPSGLPGVETRNAGLISFMPPACREAPRGNLVRSPQ